MMSGVKEEEKEKKEKEPEIKKTESPLYEPESLEWSKSSKHSVTGRNLIESSSNKNMAQSLAQRPSVGTVYQSIRETGMTYRR